MGVGRPGAFVTLVNRFSIHGQSLADASNARFVAISARNLVAQPSALGTKCPLVLGLAGGSSWSKSSVMNGQRRKTQFQVVLAPCSTTGSYNKG